MPIDHSYWIREDKVQMSVEPVFTICGVYLQ
jgi:hypothetical protein